MMTNYVLAELNKRKEFRLDFSCTIDNIRIESEYNEDMKYSGIKIDTGANGILIPLRTAGLPKDR